MRSSRCSAAKTDSRYFGRSPGAGDERAACFAGGRAEGRPRAGARVRTVAGRVSQNPGDHRAHADLHRTRGILGDVVGALLLQIVAHSPEKAAVEERTGGAGAG